MFRYETKNVTKMLQKHPPPNLLTFILHKLGFDFEPNFFRVIMSSDIVVKIVFYSFYWPVTCFEE